LVSDLGLLYASPLFDITDNNIIYQSSVGNECIYKINISTQTSTILVSDLGILFNSPIFDIIDNNILYQSSYDNNCIYKIDILLQTSNVLISELGNLNASPIFDVDNNIMYQSSASNECIYKINIDDNIGSVKISGNLNLYRFVSNTMTLFNILEIIYPINSIYMSIDETNPSTKFNFGTWEQISQGKYIAGIGEGTDKNHVAQTLVAGDDETLGEYNHTLIIDEMPSHSHIYSYIQYFSAAYTSASQYASIKDPWRYDQDTSSTGGDGAHNNIVPYFGLYIYKRTA
jgi:hypothetical protein